MNTQNKVNQILLVRNLACGSWPSLHDSKIGKDLAEEDGIKDMRI